VLRFARMLHRVKAFWGFEQSVFCATRVLMVSKVGSHISKLRLVQPFCWLDWSFGGSSDEDGEEFEQPNTEVFLKSCDSICGVLRETGETTCTSVTLRKLSDAQETMLERFPIRQSPR
jgi:hypothetical protein